MPRISHLKPKPEIKKDPRGPAKPRKNKASISEENEDAPYFDFDKELRRISQTIKSNPELHTAVKAITVSNTAATCNLDVNNIQLPTLAGKSEFATYYQNTFAALAVRLCDPWCAVLLYQIGVIVCMGSKSPYEAYCACLEYVRVLNESLKVNCSITGFKVDNFVCTTVVFPMDLTRCTSAKMSENVVYATSRFSGAIIHCEFLGLSFKTGVVVTFFSTGALIMTGVKSKEECICVLNFVYHNFFVYLDASKDPLPEYMPSVSNKEQARGLGDFDLFVEYNKDGVKHDYSDEEIQMITWMNMSASY